MPDKPTPDYGRAAAQCIGRISDGWETMSHVDAGANDRALAQAYATLEVGRQLGRIATALESLDKVGIITIPER